MKKQPAVRKPETLEEIVFEGRNQSYGAFELNRKRGKYMIIAFLVSFAGVSTAIAVPFFNALKGPETTLDLTTTVVLTLPPKIDKSMPPPPPPTDMQSVEKLVANVKPIVVVDAPEDLQLMTNEDKLERVDNLPVDIIPETPVYVDNGVIDDPDEKPILFPQEQATFMGCDLTCFHKWVADNIQYPPIAIEEQLFGKVVIEFCVNSKGEVVDIKVLRKVHPALDEEAIRVISSSPLWSPAKQGGRPVKQKFVIPCTFEMI